SGLFAVWLFLGTPILAILYLPSLILPRRFIREGIRFWGWYLRFGLWLICGITVEVRGRERLPPGPALIAAKHQGWLDVFAGFTFLPDACFVMKRELLKIPLIGWYSMKVGMVWVHREGGAAALKKLVADVQDRMRHDRQVVIFPEGTRRPPGDPGDYKPGIAALYRDLGIACSPLATNSGVHFPAKGLMKYPGKVVFEFLEPIPAGLKRGEFMKVLEERIETASNALLAEDLHS
ncbi:MAG TPA: lysophospholipid acyltransferase family protein, partial [Caulobacteraceae bacterium]|nr:lysophospholipid acyltransferase family protein [Caulobacteraceae bacterium]